MFVHNYVEVLIKLLYLQKIGKIYSGGNIILLKKNMVSVE
jgi:hypothetical protein